MSTEIIKSTERLIEKLNQAIAVFTKNREELIVLAKRYREFENDNSTTCTESGITFKDGKITDINP